jgi:hypothetical protein
MFCASFNLNGQTSFVNKEVSLDTIYASTTKTTTLIFSADIGLFDIGSEDFGGKKDHQLLMIKSVSDESKPTSLLVRYGGDLFHATIAYAESPKNLFIDLSKLAPSQMPEVPNKTRASHDDSIKNIDAQIVEKRLNMLLAEPKALFKDVVSSNEKLYVSLFSMMTDNESLYIKLYFANRSKQPYEIDRAEFAYREPVTEKDMKGQYDRKPVLPKSTNKIDNIPPKEERMLGYCIPKYSLTSKGELMIIIHEKKGTRNLKLFIPYKDIKDTKTFNP